MRDARRGPRALRDEDAARVRAQLLELVRVYGSQSAVKRRVGISQAIISKIVEGALPGPYVARKLAEHLGVSEEDLKSGRDCVADPFPNRGELRILRAWRDAAPAVQAYLLDPHRFTADLPTIDDWLKELRTAEALQRRGDLDKLGQKAD